MGGCGFCLSFGLNEFYKELVCQEIANSDSQAKLGLFLHGLQAKNGFYISELLGQGEGGRNLRRIIFCDT